MTVSWFEKLREKGAEDFKRQGFPTQKEEAWRYTNVQPIAKIDFHPGKYHPNGLKPTDLDPLACGSFNEIRLVFVHGQFAPELSSIAQLPSGVILKNLKAALQSHPDLVQQHLGRYATFQNPFVSLNTSQMSEGLFLYLPQGTVLEKPVQVLCYSQEDEVVSHLRHLIVAEAKSEVTLLESYFGKGTYWTNAVTEIATGPEAVVNHYKLQHEGSDAFHTATIQAEQKRGGRFHSYSFALGGRLARTEVRTCFKEEGAECSLEGLYLAHEEQLIDNQTCIDHAQPHGTSRELYKGILGGKANGIFNGEIIVRPNAQKTVASQTNKNLLLSDDARIHTKPLLEIHANDVKCNHGATIGRLDEVGLFYLRSRGIGEREARSLLTFAFASEMIEGIKIGPLKAYLNQDTFKHLMQAPFGEELPA